MSLNMLRPRKKTLSGSDSGIWIPSGSSGSSVWGTVGDTESESDLGGVHVDLGIPLYRSQGSIDSSLGPMVIDRSLSTWAPNVHQSKTSRDDVDSSASVLPKLTSSSLNKCIERAHLSGNKRGNSRGSSENLLALSLLGKAKSHSNTSLCSSNSSGNDSTDYGFFKNVKDADYGSSAATMDDDLPVAINYGEFNGIDLPVSHVDEDGKGSDDAGFDNLCAPLPLTRVVSFSGFESAPVYSNIFAGTMGNLRLERRKAIAKSVEFRQLRLQFAEEHILAIIHRMKRERESTK